MLDILKKVKDQELKIDELEGRYQAVKDVRDVYCGWNYAYKQAIYDMLSAGKITVDQKDLFFDMAQKHFGMWRSQ